MGVGGWGNQGIRRRLPRQPIFAAEIAGQSPLLHLFPKYPVHPVYPC